MPYTMGMSNYTTRRLDLAIREADDAFWNTIAKHYPEVKTGDFGPGETLAWQTAMEVAVETWLSNNQRVTEEV